MKVLFGVKGKRSPLSGATVMGAASTMSMTGNLTQQVVFLIEPSLQSHKEPLSFYG